MMNRSVIESSPVQQMMAGNPNWWSINTMRPPPQTTVQSTPFLAPSANLFPQFTPTSSNYSSFLVPSLNDSQDFPESWSQLLLGRVVGEEEKVNMGNFETKNKMENWEEHALHHHHPASNSSSLVNVKQETHSNNGYNMYGHANNEDHHHLHPSAKPSWSQVIMPASSPMSSCVTSFSSNSMLDFSTNNNNSIKAAAEGRHPPPERSSEGDSTAAGGASKKARVQASSTQSTFKVRKEKLGDRITALHQLVSPFGKTDTASVLLEAIGYIRFLQSQIEALSLPYLSGGSSGNNTRQPQSFVLQGERNCIFPEDPGQLLNENGMKRKAASDQQESSEAPKKDLRSRGLCLVPLSCTLQVGSDNGADYWSPAMGSGFR